MMDLKTAREKAARAWCYPKTETKEMDPELCEQFSLILHREIAELGGREPTEGALLDITTCLQSIGITLSRNLAKEIYYAAHGIEKTTLRDEG